MSLATAMSLHVCCCHFSLVSGKVRMGLERYLMSFLSCHCLTEIDNSTGHVPMDYYEDNFSLKLYCLFEATILYNKSVRKIFLIAGF